MVAATLFPLLSGCGEAEPPAAATPEDSTGGAAVAEITRPVRGGEFHLVRVGALGGRPAFDPAEIRIRRGDVVRFVMTGALPESVAFDTVGLPPDLAGFVRERNLASGVLLLSPGQVYEVRFSGAPEGRYPFYSVPRAQEGMRGAVFVD